MQFSRVDAMDQQRFDPAKKTPSSPENKKKAGNVLDEAVELPLSKTKSTTDILDSQRFDPTRKASLQQDDSRSILPDSLDELPLNDEFTIIDPLEAQACFPPATPTADATVVRKAIRRVLSLDKVLPFRPSPISTASSSRPSTSASTAMSSILTTGYPIDSQCDDIHPDSYIATKMIIPRSPSILSFDALSCYSRSAFENEVDAEVERIKECKNISVWVNQASFSSEEYRDLWRHSLQPTPSVLQVESRVEVV
ncbi:hypothetical protein IW261DRAFT_1664514 [Armillaria novae-zelandiae]|uniref:Uncharacterized protein n=1 Tax=Armillaria novae-zelandiae TaxID=153914 RepID=A0AA39UEN3_9AGAR|nr:hypothetical protein IW261DRAFT_1664514 [Armillaria novae-zelandiae]